MNTRPSRVLKLLRGGNLVTVFKLNLSEPRVVEIAGLSGVDAVWLCNEHVPNDWIALENQIRAARLHDIDTIVRVSKGSYSDYVRPLEAGATGLMVPHVTTAAEARQIVDWVRFQPLGRRALDGGNIDGLFCMLPMDEYIKHSNTEKFIIMQIESPEGLANVEEIAAVPGYDVLLLGPGDFGHRIGKPGQINDPVVVAARKKVASVARKHGKFVMSAGLIAPLPELVAEGHQIFGLGADVVALTGYFQQRLQHMKGLVDALPAASKTSTKSPYA